MERHHFDSASGFVLADSPLFRTSDIAEACDRELRVFRAPRVRPLGEGRRVPSAGKAPRRHVLARLP